MRVSKLLLILSLALANQSCKKEETDEWADTKAVNWKLQGELTPVEYTIDGIDSMSSRRITWLIPPIIHRYKDSYLPEGGTPPGMTVTYYVSTSPIVPTEFDFMQYYGTSTTSFIRTRDSEYIEFGHSNLLRHDV
jgi:hypothetical protein